ncbi:MAG: acyltransferase family protein [Roseibacillus sp.]
MPTLFNNGVKKHGDSPCRKASSGNPANHGLGRENNFDLLRLLAALQVVIAHAVHHSGLYHGLEGRTSTAFEAFILIPAVPIFFVISGFLINASFERAPNNLRGYFWRRALRIFPALWLAVLLGIGTVAWGGYLQREFVSSSTFLTWLISQTTIFQFWNPEHFRGFGMGVVNAALWTISVELQYYLFVPIAYFVSKWLKRFKHGRATLELSLFAISLGAHLFMRSGINSSGDFASASIVVKALHMTLLPHLWMFLCGVFLYRNLEALKKVLAGNFLKWAVAWAAIVFVGEYLLGDTTAGGTVLYVLSRLILACATISFAYTLPRLSGQFLKGNDISYGIYIFHCLIINVLMELGYFKTLATVPFVVVIAVLLGFLSWRFLEKPILRFKDWPPMNPGGGSRRATKTQPLPSAPPLVARSESFFSK